jgi:membrane-associated phospholipid phosphatase
MKELNKQIVKCSIAIGYLILAIVLENIYRASLFSNSLIWIKNLQHSADGFDYFFRIITILGQNGGIIPIIFFCFIFLPLNRSFILISVLSMSYYWDNLLKMVYMEARPFWVDSNLFKTCTGGYGNPSGHSLASVAFYLSLWHVLSQYTTRLWLKLLSCVLFIALILSILISRMYLGVHTANQVIYGASLGLFFYFLHMHIFQWQKLNGKEFFEMFSSVRNQITFGLYFLIQLTLALIMFYKARQEDHPSYASLENNCKINANKKFENEGLSQTFYMFTFIGVFYGCTLLVSMVNPLYQNKEDQIMNWHRNISFANQVLRILTTSLFFLPICLTFITVKNNFPIYLIINHGLGAFLPTFLIYSFGVYLSIKWKTANPEIYERNEDSLVNSEKFKEF